MDEDIGISRAEMLDILPDPFHPAKIRVIN
jgi:hypothetical protein